MNYRKKKENWNINGMQPKNEKCNSTGVKRCTNNIKINYLYCYMFP